MYTDASRGARALLLLVVGALALASTPPMPASARPVAQALEGQALVQALRGGGYTIFLRHSITNPDDDTRIMEQYGQERLDSCEMQRNLTDEGRDQARAIGAAFRQLNIPVGDVLSSPYCRAMETANLAFGRATPLDALGMLPYQNVADREPSNATLRQLLTTAPTAGTNLVIVSHSTNLIRAVDVTPESEGDAVIFRPGNDAPLTPVAIVPASDWAALAGP
ncbi:MAG TPA: histidine phosphatase family protein [Chloroflexota bacterium]|jgi:phosphohistidine phosphatase SixA